MKKTIYIGVPHKDGFKYADGTAFADVPYVALYNQSNKTYCEATCTYRSSDNGYNFEISAEVTSELSAGVYTLEIYNHDKTELLYRDEYYARVTRVAVSPNNTHIEPESSES